MAEYVDLPFGADTVAPEALCFPCAVRFAAAVRKLPFVEFHSALKSNDQSESKEVIIFDTAVERPQQVCHPIGRWERLAAVFYEDENLIPEVLALRADFPLVPHLNMRTFERPRSLCLYDEDPRDIMLRWTPLAFIERIRQWLSLTATGELHAQDQPLEPLLMHSGGVLVLTEEIWDRLANENDQAMFVRPLTESNDTDLILMTFPADSGSSSEPTPFIALPFTCRAVTHGIIRRQPGTLKELADLVSAFGLDLVAELRSRLDCLSQNWASKKYYASRPVLLLNFPKSRQDGHAPEESEVWAFVGHADISETGKALGIWDISNGEVGRMVPADESRQGEDISVLPLKTVRSFSRESAASLSGTLPKQDNMVLIGAGALGSQVFLNAIRAGQGNWTIVDHDRLLPHNLARHALGMTCMGRYKAEMLSNFANALVDGQQVSTSITADVFNPGEKEAQLGEACSCADAFIDASASVSVARHLALDIKSSGRRISIFFTPSGSASVMLAEDAHRQTPLDMLEMQYYREIATCSHLGNHLALPSQKIRYAASCRDLTSQIPQDVVSLHASLCWNAIKQVLAGDSGLSGIWTLETHFHNVSFMQIPAPPLFEKKSGEWRIRTDEQFLARLQELRAKKLPNETGGILIGSHDMKRRIIYLVDTIPSPPDSCEWPAVYIRGCRGLATRLREIEDKTAGNLVYAGEWHSHPDGVSAAPSLDDKKAFDWQQSEMQSAGLPPVMAIAGRDDINIFAETMEP